MLILLFLVIISSVFSVNGNAFKPSSTESNERDPSVDADVRHIGTQRAKRLVQVQQTQQNKKFQECILPTGEPGHCKHFQYCSKSNMKTDSIKFMQQLCIIEGTTIGVCCPDEQEPSLSEQLAGELPATASLDEDQQDTLLRMSGIETRGCGVSSRPIGRLIGASPAEREEWPWMAFITPEGFEQHCGGFLITDRHVLTAAHCTVKWYANELFVRLGEYDYERSNDTRSYDFRVVEKREHQLFDNVTYQNDIAILKLHRPAVFNTYVWPVCLPPRGMNLVNKTAVILGWGTQSFGGPTSNVLMEASVPVWEHQHCVSSFTDTVFEENICAGAYEGGKDACQGDSGGPLMYQMPSGRWTAVGIVSWGIRCGESNHPGIYTRIDKYLPWIIENAVF